MEATTKVQLLSLEPYRYLFPKANVKDYTIKRGAEVSDTVHLIPDIIRKTKWQAKEYVERELKGLPIREACEKLWNFIKYHIKYTPDQRRFEQVRSWRRMMHDGKGDCDCFTASIGTALSYFADQGIRIINRIAAYKADFQHIYPIVVLRDGSTIIMDCVVHAFNYEEPYSKKEDYEMDLQFLDGIEDTESSAFSGNVDAEAFAGFGLGDLGKLKLFKNKSSVMPGADGGGGKKKGFQRVKDLAKKALNLTNKINPATAVLRAGILASMKTNVMKVAEKLRWAYLTEDEAKNKGMDMSRFPKLKNVLTKIEQIFYTAGGNPENLKKAILTGRGNKSREVHGLGLIDQDDIRGFEDSGSLRGLLGDIYDDEFVNGLEGADGLGVVATSASIAAASSVMATIAALLKSVGNLFPNKGAEKGDGGNSDPGGGDPSEDGSDNTGGSDAGENPGGTKNLPVNKSSNNAPTDKSPGDDSTDGTGDGDGDGTTPKGFKAFWEKNKSWAKPVGITVGAAIVAVGGYFAIKAHKKKKENQTEKERRPDTGQAVLHGFSKHDHQKRKKKKKQEKKTPIALM